MSTEAPASFEPALPKGSYRITLKLEERSSRLDQVLMTAMRNQGQNLDLKNMSRTQFKELFRKKRIRIKGQPATPSSSIAAGETYVDILGYGLTTEPTR